MKDDKTIEIKYIVVKVKDIELKLTQEELNELYCKIGLLLNKTPYPVYVTIERQAPIFQPFMGTPMCSASGMGQMANQSFGTLNNT